MLAGLLSLRLASCSASGGPPADLALDAGAQDVGDAGRQQDAADAGPSLVGTPCTTGSTVQGSCPAGHICFPAATGMTGGYCTKFCAFDAAVCSGDAVCVLSPRSGEICAKKCKTSDDCRSAEGYVCDADWQVCFIAKKLSPLLKKCAATAPLPRTAFGKVTQLSTKMGPGKYHVEPAAGLDAAGNLTAIYMAPSGLLDGFGLAASTLKASGKLDGDRALSGTSKQIFDPWLATDRSGKLFAVYYGHDGLDVNGVVGLISSGDGIGWSSEKLVHDPGDCTPKQAGCFDKTMIAIGPRVGAPSQDAIYVFYYAAQKNEMRVVRSTDGGKTFSKSTSVGKIGAYGDAEVASDGSIHVVAVVGSGDRLGDSLNRIEYVRSVDGAKTFSAPVRVSATTEPVPFYFSNAQVAVSTTTGGVHVVYPAGLPDGAWDIKLASSGDAGKSWTRIKVNDDPHCANHMTPTIARDPATGTLHVAWAENRGGRGQIAYAVCDSAGKQCSANQAISDQPFADYQLVRHSPRWLGEYLTLIVDGPKRALHAIWTQTVSENGLATARIFHAKGSL